MSLREIYLGEEWLHEGDGYIRYVTIVMGIRFVAMVMYITMVIGIRFVAMVMYVTTVMPYKAY